MTNIESRRESALDDLASRYASGLLDESAYQQARQAVARADSVAEIATILGENDPGVPAEPGQTVTAILGERRATGDILHHRYVAATAVMGSLTLDLRDAVVARDVRIHIVAVMAELEVLLPAGVRVTSSVTPLLAEYRDDSRQSGDPGAPCIEFTGTAILSEVRFR